MCTYVQYGKLFPVLLTKIIDIPNVIMIYLTYSTTYVDLLNSGHIYSVESLNRLYLVGHQAQQSEVSQLYLRNRLQNSAILVIG